MHRVYFYQFICYGIFFSSQTTTQQLSNQTVDYLEIRSLPPVLHNQQVYVPVLYQCSTKRWIDLYIEIEHAFFGPNIIVFRQYWYCQFTADVHKFNVHVQLHPSIAYAADNQTNLYSWPVEFGLLNLIMYDKENEIIEQIQYTVQFLPVHQRPKAYSIGWNPLVYRTDEQEICLVEPGE